MLNKMFITRILFFIIGINFIALGVSLTAKVELGTSPISAIPYALSLYFKFLSFGNWVILFNILLIFMEVILLQCKINFLNISSQLILAFIFGYLIDLYIFILNYNFPGYYFAKLSLLILGCAIMAFGAYFEIISNTSMLPGDAFILSISVITKLDFGKIRMLSDLCMSIIAVLICIVLNGDFFEIREGTLIAALITGSMVKAIMSLTTKH